MYKLINLTRKELKETLNYNPLTGDFVRLIPTLRIKIGQKVGTKNKRGYIVIQINGKNYYAHRLAWFYMEGYFPENLIDHIDRNPSNNKWNNLREVSQQCNMRNSKVSKKTISGVSGVNWNGLNKKWNVSIGFNGKTNYLGEFKSLDESVCLRLVAEQCLNWSGCDSSTSAYKYVQKMLEKNKKGFNLRSCCHKCRESVFHYKGQEHKTILPFYKKHINCIKENGINVETKEDQNQWEDWMREYIEINNKLE